MSRECTYPNTENNYKAIIAKIMCYLPIIGKQSTVK